MKRLALLIILVFLLSCSRKENFRKDDKKVDTIVAKTNIKNEYYTRVTRYNLIIAGDSSRTCIFSYQDKDGKVNLHLGLGSTSRKVNYIEQKPYRQRYNEIKKLMPYATADFNTDSLKDISIGFLMETGDLAIDVSREYFKRYGNPGRLNWQQIHGKKREHVHEILMSSRCSENLNRLLYPIGKKIDKVNPIEKLMFEPKETVFRYNVVESDTTQIPEYIMDGHISFTVTNK